MSPGTQCIRLLAAYVDVDDKEESEYRFLIDDKHVKYVTTDPGALAGIDRTFEPDVVRIVPEFPSGDWTEGRMAKDARTGALFFSSVSTARLPAVERIWHPTLIDHLELEEVGQLRQNIHQVRHASFCEPVVFKFATFPWEIQFLEAETRAYEWIRDANDVGPKFLAHVTEGGRVIGFLMEHVQGAAVAELGDLDACRAALARLHSLGIKHGDVNKNNFLLQGRKVTIVDFETATRCDDKEQLQAEFEALEDRFKDPWNPGGITPVS